MVVIYGSQTHFFHSVILKSLGETLSERKLNKTGSVVTEHLSQDTTQRVLDTTFVIGIIPVKAHFPGGNRDNTASSRGITNNVHRVGTTWVSSESGCDWRSPLVLPDQRTQSSETVNLHIWRSKVPDFMESPPNHFGARVSVLFPNSASARLVVPLIAMVSTCGMNVQWSSLYVCKL